MLNITGTVSINLWQCPGHRDRAKGTTGFTYHLVQEGGIKAKVDTL